VERVPEYRVKWEIDVDGDDPVGAVRRARAAQIRPGTTATVFSVVELHPDHRYPVAVYDDVDLGGPGEPGNVSELIELMSKIRGATQGTPEGAVEAEIDQLRGNAAADDSFAPSVWVVNCTKEVDGLYVFLEEDQAREHAARYGDSAAVSEEIVMNGSAGAQFLVDTAGERE
jgi:hypothetical protein